MRSISEKKKGGCKSNDKKQNDPKDIFSNKNAYGVANTGGFKAGFGLGLRINTPIGPIMLDYGIPMNKTGGEDTKKSGRFHFSASHGF